MHSSKQTFVVMFILSILLMAAITISCIPQAGKEAGVKPLAEMTPKEKATWMMGVYNAQAADYKRMVVRTDLTDDQKDILRQKKVIAVQVWPLINTYRTYVNAGAVPIREVEDQIIALINDLTVLVLPHVVE